MDSAISSTTPIGKRVRLARIGKNLRQYELASYVNVTANFISQVESGRKNPSLSTIQKIAKVLDVNVSTLLGEDPIIDDLKSIAAKYDIKSIIAALERMK